MQRIPKIRKNFAIEKASEVFPDIPGRALLAAELFWHLVEGAPQLGVGSEHHLAVPRAVPLGDACLSRNACLAVQFQERSRDFKFCLSRTAGSAGSYGDKGGQEVRVERQPHGYPLNSGVRMANRGLWLRRRCGNFNNIIADRNFRWCLLGDVSARKKWDLKAKDREKRSPYWKIAYKTVLEGPKRPSQLQLHSSSKISHAQLDQEELLRQGVVKDAQAGQEQRNEFLHRCWSAFSLYLKCALLPESGTWQSKPQWVKVYIANV